MMIYLAPSIALVVVEGVLGAAVFYTVVEDNAVVLLL
ncbi:unnamed protein product, partial [Rotaria sp. Silwood2]